MKMLKRIEEIFGEIEIDSNNDWSVEYMIDNAKWNNIRNVANAILLMLGEI